MPSAGAYGTMGRRSGVAIQFKVLTVAVPLWVFEATGAPRRV
ncbi:hypothetical protein [Streptomyces sp. Ncost-T10-10d]|nr:hypothetical protein [Streptomyces sp. Ncost-T10-10d]